MECIKNEHTGWLSWSSFKDTVFVLADVFETFISTSLEYYGLDTYPYFFSSRLGWDAMLKMTGIEVKLFSDTDMYLFIERGIRGAISFISKRYSKANNKHMKCCNSGKESNFIMYMIELNLYGWAMSQYLPYEGFN